MYIHKIPQSIFFFDVADPVIYRRRGEQDHPENFKKLLMLILDSPYLHLPVSGAEENRKPDPPQSKN